MIHALIYLGLFLAGAIIGANFGSQEARMEGFDEGFRAGKAYLEAKWRAKIEFNTLYGKFSNGREE